MTYPTHDDYYQTYRLLAAYLVFLDQLPLIATKSRE